jgi:hypothetical protein
MGDTLWTKTYGGNADDYSYSVQQIFDNGYIITGTTSSFGAGAQDVWLIKTNSFGDTLWTKTYGGSDLDWSYSVQQTTDSGYIIIGNSYSIISNNTDIFLIKTDALGDTLWTKKFGGSLNEFGFSGQQTSDGGYIVVGFTTSFGAGEEDLWLIKTNALGNILWTKAFGGSFDEFGHSVTQTADDGYIIAGYTRSTGNGNSDVWLIRTNSLGDTIWTKTLGGIYNDEAYSIQRTSDEDYVITGYTQSLFDGGEDIWLIKINDFGDTLWTKKFGSVSTDERGRSGQQTTDGGFIITGHEVDPSAPYDFDVLLIKTTPSITSTEINSELLNINFFLEQNFPNPFNPSTTIRYEIPERSFVTIKVYDVLGHEIATLVNEEKPAGNYEVEFSASNLASGIYFCILSSGNFLSSKKMILLR